MAKPVRPELLAGKNVTEQLEEAQARIVALESALALATQRAESANQLASERRDRVTELNAELNRLRGVSDRQAGEISDLRIEATSERLELSRALGYISATKGEPFERAVNDHGAYVDAGLVRAIGGSSRHG